MEILIRPRRNRKNRFVRDLIQENQISQRDFIYPMFVIEGQNIKDEIKSMPNIFRFSLDKVIEECETLLRKGLRAIALFPVVNDDQKDKLASFSYQSDNFYLHAIEALKKGLPELVVFSDVAMDPYSTDGHDGFVDESGEILNDKSLGILSAMSVAQAQAGVDFVAPSDMMDGRIKHIRRELDKNGFEQTGIMSYSAKFASAYYGPFRDALDSAPKSGDKKTYQLNPANRREALLETKLDIDEGADIVMVKPGLPYLDIIRDLKEKIERPLAVYNVSGEYAMVHSAAQKGCLDYKNVVLENMLAFKRAGADIILSYHVKDILEWISNE